MKREGWLSTAILLGTNLVISVLALGVINANGTTTDPSADRVFIANNTPSEMAEVRTVQHHTAPSGRRNERREHPRHARDSRC
jgi:hypothetical protein